MVQPCSANYQEVMQNLLIEHGIENYKYYLKDVMNYLECNTNDGVCGPLRYTLLTSPSRGLIPKEDQEKIDNFLDRMSSVLCKCCLHPLVSSTNANRIESFMFHSK